MHQIAKSESCVVPTTVRKAIEVSYLTQHHSESRVVKKEIEATKSEGPTINCEKYTARSVTFDLKFGVTSI